MTKPKVAWGSSLGTSVAIFWGPPSTSRPPAIPWFACLIATPLHSHTHAWTHTVCSSSQYHSVDGRETVAKRPGFLASCRSASLVGLYCHHPNLSAQSHHCFSFFVCVCGDLGGKELVFSVRRTVQGLRRSKKINIMRGLLEASVWEEKDSGLGVIGHPNGCTTFRWIERTGSAGLGMKGYLRFIIMAGRDLICAAAF